MEYLTELQRIGAVVDLWHWAVSMWWTWEMNRRTTSNPVTLTSKLATVPEDGCASFVVTLCCTFSNGSDWRGRVSHGCAAKGESTTASLATIASAPAIWSPSKVSMELPRWRRSRSV